MENPSRQYNYVNPIPVETRWGTTGDAYLDPMANRLIIIQDNKITKTGVIVCSYVDLDCLRIYSFGYQLKVNQIDLTPLRLTDLTKQSVNISFIDIAKDIQ